MHTYRMVSPMVSSGVAVCRVQLAGSLFPVEGVLIANMQNNLYGDDVAKVRIPRGKWNGICSINGAFCIGSTVALCVDSIYYFS